MRSPRPLLWWDACRINLVHRDDRCDALACLAAFYTPHARGIQLTVDQAGDLFLRLRDYLRPALLTGEGVWVRNSYRTGHVPRPMEFHEFLEYYRVLLI